MNFIEVLEKVEFPLPLQCSLCRATVHVKSTFFENLNKVHF